MEGRPSRSVIGAEVLVLLAAIALAAIEATHTDWDLGLLAILLTFAVVSDLRAVDLSAHHVAMSGSFLAIIMTAVFMGATAAAIVGVITILVGWLKERYSGPNLLINLVTYSWFPLLAGVVFHETVDQLGIETGSTPFYLLIFAVFVFGLGINFLVIAGYTCYEDGSSLGDKFRRTLVPILPSELATALLTVGVALIYVETGLAAIALFGIVLLIFQYLLGALLLSRERAEQLEVRARQLAGFQVALLSALLRTLDLRDRTTARHAAAVARYSREIAVIAELAEDDQELAHTAGLLHDIGKFVLPDRILKPGVRLDEADLEQIRRHPEEGARIVSQIDGYTAVGEIILAHHERIDGLGYPHKLSEDEIPELAKVIAVANTYDALTSRDRGEPRSSFEALAAMREASGTWLDGRYVEALAEALAGKDPKYKSGDDANFESELAADRLIREYVMASRAPRAEPERPEVGRAA